MTVDVAAARTVRGEAFDRRFVREQLRDMLGDDERLLRWDEMCRRVP